jgi:uncharacterized membrane protein YbhN (UPF0104 family)
MLLTLGALTFFLLASRRALVAATATLAHLKAVALLALLAFALWTLASAVAWRALLASSGIRKKPGLAHLWLIRFEAQAVNLVLPLAGFGGEALRISALRHNTHQGTASTASVILDMTTEVAACFLFAGLGTLVDWHAMRHLPVGLWVAGVATSIALSLAAWFAPVLLPRVALWTIWGQRTQRLSRLAEVMKRARRSGMGLSFAWHMVERVLIATEAYIYAHALGLPMSILGAVFATALLTLLGSILFFIPGQIGAAEGGLVLGMLGLGFAISDGLALAMARRLRQLLVGIVGVAILLLTVGLRALSSAAASEQSVAGQQRTNT